MTGNGSGPRGDPAPAQDEMHAIAACQKGDRHAYELIVRRYAARAVGLARSILRDATLAEDVAQEAFVRAYRAIRRFDLTQRFYPWFHRILKNCCLTALRRRGTPDLSLDAENAPPVAATTGDPVSRAARKELRATIEAAMARLTAPHREILHLAHFEQLSYKEIAACLDIPVGTVMSRLFAARQALKKVLGPMLGREEGASDDD